MLDLISTFLFFCFRFCAILLFSVVVSASWVAPRFECSCFKVLCFFFGFLHIYYSIYILHMSYDLSILFKYAIPFFRLLSASAPCGVATPQPPFKIQFKIERHHAHSITYIACKNSCGFPAPRTSKDPKRLTYLCRC